MLKGPLPAGDYRLSAEGYQPTGDAMLHVDLLLRTGGGDTAIVSFDSNVPKGSDAGAPGGIEATARGAAVTASCGDLLVMRAKLISGGSGFIELAYTLSIP